MMSDEPKRKFVSGSARLIDGTRVQLSEEECTRILDSIERARAERATAMPTTVAALQAIISANKRIEELGWKNGHYCPRDRQPFAVIEVGSTGCWEAYFDGMYVIYAGCVNSPDRLLWKPLDKLTEDERTVMEECDAHVRTMIDDEMAAFADIELGQEVK